MRKWLEEDVIRLKELYFTRGLRAPDIATLMNRSVGAIRMKISTLNLSRYE